MSKKKFSVNLENKSRFVYFYLIFSDMIKINWISDLFKFGQILLKL